MILYLKDKLKKKFATSKTFCIFNNHRLSLNMPKRFLQHVESNIGIGEEFCQRMSFFGWENQDNYD